ncbi:MAG: M3 family metallopeptidase, partial [Clostridiales Family XIII bacterium]|nr:M3 family metallopeptidase [Clostridiales Family XIII bacterium]
MGKKRSEIPSRSKWNLKAMYPNEKLWEDDFAQAKENAENYTKKYSGKLGKDAKTLLSAFRDADHVWQLTEKVFVYARMRRDEDNQVSKYQTLCDRAQTLIAEVSAALSFFTPEFLSIPKKKLDAYMVSSAGLRKYTYSIEVIQRQKAHVLPKDQEHLMAQLGEVLGSTGEVFTMLNNADLRFGKITDENAHKVELTHGNYITFMESKNRKVRKAAFEGMYRVYDSHINALATNYAYNTKVDTVTSRIRGYNSALERALSADNVPVRVYDNLIQTVGENLNLLHRYMNVRKEILKLPKLRMYDIYVPLFSLKNDKVSFK